MRRLVHVLILVSLGVQIKSLHADINSSARVRTQARFKKGCDDEGQGKACYDYGRSLWNTGGIAARKSALKYLLRGCELKYHFACEAYQEHNSSNHRSATKHTKSLPPSAGPTGPCFKPADLGAAQFYPNMISATSVHGQLVGNIQPKSFWDHAGFKEADIIVRINNEPFNSSKEALKIFSESGKNFSFEVERNHETITMWYTCE